MFFIKLLHVGLLVVKARDEGTKIHFRGEFCKYIYDICTVIQRGSAIREISWFDIVKPRFLLKTKSYIMPIHKYSHMI